MRFDSFGNQDFFPVSWVACESLSDLFLLLLLAIGKLARAKFRLDFFPLSLIFRIPRDALVGL